MPGLAAVTGGDPPGNVTDQHQTTPDEHTLEGIAVGRVWLRSSGEPGRPPGLRRGTSGCRSGTIGSLARRAGSGERMLGVAEDLTGHPRSHRGEHPPTDAADGTADPGARVEGALPRHRPPASVDRSPRVTRQLGRVTLTLAWGGRVGR